MRYSQGTRADRIVVLRRLIATERQLLGHPTYARPAARLLAHAREELAALEGHRAVPIQIGAVVLQRNGR